MPRDLSALPRLTTTEQVLDFMRQAPQDRLLQTDSDLTPDEWNDRGSAVRGNDTIYTIVSLARSGVDNIPAYIDVDLQRGRHSTYATWPEELAVVDEQAAQALIHDAEEGFADRRLSRGPVADMWVLRSHPQAETDDQIVKEFGHLPSRPGQLEPDKGPFWRNTPQLTRQETTLLRGWLFEGRPVLKMPIALRLLGWLGNALVLVSLGLDIANWAASGTYASSWISAGCFLIGVGPACYYFIQDNRRRLKTDKGRIDAWGKPVTSHVLQQIQEYFLLSTIDHLDRLKGTDPDNMLRFYHLSMLLTGSPFDGEPGPVPTQLVRPGENV